MNKKLLAAFHATTKPINEPCRFVDSGWAERAGYVPYGPEWEKEMMKLPKKFLIEMIRRIKKGA